MKACIRPGCTAKVRARGMCNNHYTQWHKRLPTKLGTEHSRDKIRAAMPGTLGEIAAKVGRTYEAVRKAVSKMHAAGLVHIEDFRPPTEVSGSRYAAVFTDGPGEDAKLSKKELRENSLAVRRAWYAANKSRPRHGDPLVLALFGRAPANQGREAA
jgi:hypothetical protein